MKTNSIFPQAENTIETDVIEENIIEQDTIKEDIIKEDTVLNDNADVSSIQYAYEMMESIKGS